MHALTLCVLFLALPLLQGELVQVIQLGRHGARTPNSFEFLPNQYAEQEGQLTVLGLVQQYFLGQEMRKRYIEDTPFLQETFNSSEVLIKSSWKNRTVRSALSFVNGMYPQDDGVWIDNIYTTGFSVDQLIPLKKRVKEVSHSDMKRVRINEDWAKEVVEIISLDGDLYFHAHKSANCPPAEKIVKEIKKSREITEMERFFHLTLYPALASGVNSHLGHELINPDLLDIKKAKSVLDNYRCNMFHGKDHPYIDEPTLKFLKKTRYFHAYKLMLVDDLVRAISASKLLDEIRHFTRSMRDGAENIPKFIFYSAHDTNLEILFSIFLFESQIAVEDHYNVIPFSSVVSFELHKEIEYIEEKNGTETKEEYYVKMLYNDEPQLIKWCLGYQCTLNQFHKILEHYIIPNLEEFCQAGKIHKITKSDESLCSYGGDDVNSPCGTYMTN